MKLIKGEIKEKLDLLLAPTIKAGFPSPAEARPQEQEPHHPME
jgi:hypothetical protein